MTHLFRRKPIAELLVDEHDSTHSLKRVLGAGDLVMLSIGAVIGAGIFGAIGTAAAGQVDASGHVVRAGAGPALVFSFLLLGGACALSALCYAELAAMIPQAGSAYAYSYATLGELVAWIIGWDLILEYAVGNVAVAISWGDYFNTLVRGVGMNLPAVSDNRLSDGAPERQSRRPRSAEHGAANCRHPDSRQHPRLRHRVGHHLAAAARRARELQCQQRDGGHQAHRARPLHRRGCDAPDAGELPPLRAKRFHRDPPGRGHRVLCLHRVRRDLDRGGRDTRPSAESANRDTRRTGDLHAHLRHRRSGADRDGPVQNAGEHRGSSRLRPAGDRIHGRGLAGGARRGRVDVRRSAGLPVRAAAHLLLDGARRSAAAVGGPRPSGVSHSVHDHGADRCGGGSWRHSSAMRPKPTISPTSGRCSHSRWYALGSSCSASTEPERPRPFRVPLVWLVCMLGAAACVFVMAGLPRQAWERFGIWLAVGLVLYFAYGFKHSRLNESR